MQSSTYFPTAEAALRDRKWWLIDAAGINLGRLSTEAARRLSGKAKPTWTPFIDCGDFVVVINCEKVAMTGRKEGQKMYRHHTGYPGGLKEVAAGKMRARFPERLIEESVRGMLPKTRLGRAMGRKLKVYAGAEHPHAAQLPQVLDLGLPRSEDEV